MIFSKFEKEILLSDEQMNTYKNIAFDGCNFYFLIQNEAKVVKCCHSFKIINTFETEREYDYISYDRNSDCFWANAKEFKNRLFKLNDMFQEVDYLNIGIDEKITGLSYINDSDNIIISFETCVGVLVKKNYSFELIYKSTEMKITGVLSVLNGCYINIETVDKKSIMFLNKRNYLVKRIYIASDILIKNIVCLQDDENEMILYSLIIKNDGCTYVNISTRGNQTLKEDVPLSISEKAINNVELINEEDESDINVISFAEFLNNECEKFEEKISKAESIYDIITANNDIKLAINEVTQSEHQLYIKLKGSNKCDQ